MGVLRSMRDRALSHSHRRRGANEQPAFGYSDHLYDIVDELIWPAVHYADGPMRPYIRQDPMFTEFRQNVEGFEALFKSDRHHENYEGPSKRIPAFVRNYLHQQLERDLEWLDGQFVKDENCHLVYALLHNMVEMHGFKVGIVIRLVIHLLQLVPLYGPTDRPSHHSFPPDIGNKSTVDEGAGYRSSALVERSIGNEPQFLWVRSGVTKICHFAVSHSYQGSMDQCWLNPGNVRGSTPYVRIDPFYYGNRGVLRRDSDDHDHITECYDPPENLLCIFRVIRKLAKSIPS
ncbi:hypothetical protein GGR51DRAFT_578485 [Nemania sp. FL0031]|nr:hypothetical protein GGR51DRAFT_578485 [Nemania sp. FL0031]